MKYIYGPVKSRRLGLSLGITLTPYKICTFDCVYCQLGRTKELTIERKEYLNIEEILEELRFWLQEQKETKEVEYITFSGSGEPTLNIKIGELISRIKKITSLPVAIITNAALLSSVSLRQQLRDADLILPSLDAVTPEVFSKVDRPAKEIKIEEIIQGLIDLRKEFRGKLWLEVMLVKGVNDDLRYIKKLKAVIDEIGPDKIQLNSPVRATAEPDVTAPAARKLQKIKEILGEKCEII